VRAAQVTEDLVLHVQTTLAPMLEKLYKSAKYLESEGGVDGIDVRLM
jgi:hypothetical protein